MKKKLISSLVGISLVLISAESSFAMTPWQYDGQNYGNLGIVSGDPDGEVNLAVIANGDVKLYGDAMYICGSVYSNGTVYAGDGQGNKVDGMLISGTEDTVFASDTNNDEWTKYREAKGFIHVNDQGNTDGINYYSTQIETEGAIFDDDTSFDCSYTDFTVPTITNDLGDFETTMYYNSVWFWSEERGSYSEPGSNAPITITEDSHIGTLTMNGTQNSNSEFEAAMTIDTTAGDVTVVIDKLVATNPSIRVIGDNKAYIYINEISEIYGLALNYNLDNYDENWQIDPIINGNMDNTYLYLNGGNINMGECHIAANKIYVNADVLNIGGASEIVADIDSGVDEFTVTGGTTSVTGVVCVPNAASNVIDSGTLYGQIHTNTLLCNGSGRIIYKADSMSEELPTSEPTDAPEESTEPVPTVEPAEPSTGDDEIFAGSSQYAYIFGDEPIYIEGDKDEDGNVISWTVEVYMAPERAVSRQEVCAMIMRLVDQCKTSVNAGEGDIAETIVDYDDWAAKGLGFLSKQGAFDDIDYTVSGFGAVSRGEVAKLVVKGLGLSLQEGAIQFDDIAGNEFENYINIMTSNGFMQGDGDGSFRPSDVITRAEFCSMFNNVTGRTNYELVSADGEDVTPETYYIVDLEGVDDWKVREILLGTSAFTSDKKVDVETRIERIRNVLDDYEGQTQY